MSQLSCNVMSIWLLSVLLVIFEASCAEHEGETSRQGRVVGVFDCAMEDYPFFVSIQTRYGDRFCGGSIIHSSWVLSAAHCFIKMSKPSYIQVQSSRETRAVVKIVTHQGFETRMDSDLRNDIGMIKVRRRFDKSKVVQLPSSLNQTDRCVMSLMMGWGTHWGEAGVVARNDMTGFSCVHLFVTSTNFCVAFSPRLKPEGIICTSWPYVGKGPCLGDSGGPLLCQDDPNTVIGIVSSGFGCALPIIPTTYTRVDHYLDFIQEAIDSGNVDGKSLVLLLCVCIVACCVFVK